jgi:hypothetical protein
VTGRGAREIDAAGRYVSPGWIDMMDQSGATLLENGLAENKLREGVTTAIGGEGGTPVPADRILEYFARLERQGIARETGKDPADAAFDLVSQGQGRVMAVYHMMSEPDIETALKFAWTSIGSDAGSALGPGQPDAIGLPHPRAYGNFPRVIARYVRERHTLGLAEAIRKMTSWPAMRMRLSDRGLIREGLWADVVVFDYDTIQDRSTYEQPNLYPDGIDWVVVNGEVVIDHGRHTGARPGKVLYGPGRRIAQQQTEASRPILAAPIEATVPKAPTPFKADGKTHLVYELTVTNLGAEDCLLDRVTVVAADGVHAELSDCQGQRLADAVARPGVPALRGTAKLTIAAAQRAVVYVWVSVAADATAPRALQHRITVKVGEGQRVITTDAGRVTVSGNPRAATS